MFTPKGADVPAAGNDNPPSKFKACTVPVHSESFVSMSGCAGTPVIVERKNTKESA